MKTLEGEEIPRRKHVALYATMTSRNQINQPWKSDPYQVLVLAYITVGGSFEFAQLVAGSSSSSSSSA